MLLEGCVAVVTGAGRGLGRAHALELAARGAAVVANDYGVAWDGTATHDRPAQQVVDEITAAGGRAIAHDGDVADWDASRTLIERAVAEFGDLTLLVNNAGFVRDRMIFNMSLEEWESVVRVHLTGHFCTTRHATAYWRERSKAAGGPVWARIVNTSSEAYLFGSPGQPNYAAAKAGIVALTLATAQSCGRYGVTVNAICPRARTQMTEQTFGDDMAAPEDGFDAFAPENVSPLVAALGSREAGGVTGQVFVTYGDMVQVVSGPGIAQTFRAAGRWDAAALAGEMAGWYGDREPGAGYAVPAS